MKRRDFSLAALAAAGLPVMAQAPAKKPEEGVDYLALDKRVATEVGEGKIELIEFFWYSCPHCNAFEPRFSSWVKSAPKDVVVKRVPVRFRDDFEAQQRAYYVFESLGLLDTCTANSFMPSTPSVSNSTRVQPWPPGLAKTACLNKSLPRHSTALALPPRHAVPRSCKRRSRCRACLPWVLLGGFTPTVH